MFVSTHKMVWGIGLKNEMSLQHVEEDYFIGETGRLYNPQFMERLSPITLPCPYCHATINQQERVECECGFQMEAITEKQFNLIMGASQELIDLGSKQYLLPRYVNNIHWLELTPGKEKK